MKRGRKRTSQTHRDAMQGVTQAAFARGKKVTRQAVRVAIQTGRIRFIRGTKRLDPKRAARDWDANADVAKRREAEGPRARGGRDRPTLTDEKRRREAALASMAELELQQKLGEIVSREAVANEASDCARRTKDRVLAVPAAIIDRLEELGLADVVTGQKILTDALVQALEGVAGELTAAPPPASEEKAS